MCVYVLQDKKVFSNFLKDTWFRFATNENHPMKEDCLTVNVFSPTHPSKALEAKALPVSFCMFFFYFYSSFISLYD